MAKKESTLSNRTSAKNKGNRGSWILDAAAKLFAESSFEQTAIAEIAAQAGVAEGTIYRYFATKEDLLFAVVTRMVQTAYDNALPIMAKPQTPEQKLSAFVLNHFVQIADHIDAARLFLSEVRGTQAYKTSKF